MKIDAYRRNLQRAYLDLANTKVNGTAAGRPPVCRPVFRRRWRPSSAALPATMKSPSTAPNCAPSTPPWPPPWPRPRTARRKAHLEGARDQIAKILDPKFAPTAAGGGAVIRIGTGGIDLFSATPDQIGTCWPDYVVRPD